MSLDFAPISVCITEHQPDAPHQNEHTVERRPQPRTPRASPEPEVNQDDHHKRIDQLAQPKKAFPGGPARLNQKPKTVAFGQTVNVSQCVEGRVLNNKSKKTLHCAKKMDRPRLATHAEEEKENAQQPAGRDATAVEKRKAKTSPRVEESVPGQDMLQVLESVKSMIVQYQKETDQRLKGIEDHIIRDNSRALVQAPRAATTSNRLTDTESDLLRDLDYALKKNPLFARPVLELCREHASNAQNNRVVAGHDHRMGEKYRREDSAKPWREQPQGDYPRNSTVTEKITLERSYPNDYPYSVNSRKFLEQRSASRQLDIPQQSTYRDGMSVAFNEPRRMHREVSPPLRSNYKSGNSVVFAPDSRSYYNYDVPSEDDSEHNISFPEISEPDTQFPARAADLSQRQAERKARLRK